MFENMEREKVMENRKITYRFETETLEKMDEFERDFLENSYKKDTSENKGPYYKEKMANEDADAFGEYLDSDYSDEFLNLR